MTAIVMTITLLVCQQSAGSTVAPLDPTKIDPADFNVEEVRYAYYLRYLADVANAVVMEGPNRGFIDLKVWRRAKDNQPYNARVLENHAALAFFYTEKRPWNVYYGDPALKIRLEAVLEFWCRSQHTDGRFSEYAPEQWSLPPTAFGVKFMGETLRRLHESQAHGGPTIDPEIHARTVDATRKAIGVLLTDPGLLRHGSSYSNQYTGFWGGTLAFLSAHPDRDLRRRLIDRVREALPVLTSPVGYHRERDGCDWQYTLGTHKRNVVHAWNYARDSELGNLIVEMERPWIEWLSYNAVLEPDSQYFTLNRAIETRRSMPGFTSWETPVAERIVTAAAFSAGRSAYYEDLAAAKKKLIENWPDVGPLTSYSPHVFVDETYNPECRPTIEQRNSARLALPYLSKNRFSHLRVDDRFPVQYLFIRRPTFYAVFNSGKLIHPRQHYGLGLLWNPKIGSVMQTHSKDSGGPCWGTASPTGEVYEASGFEPKMTVGGKSISLQPGIFNLPEGEMTVEYALGTQGNKCVTFTDRSIEVAVTHSGEFVEHLPLLVRKSDRVNFADDHVRIERTDGAMTITFVPRVKVQSHLTGGAHGPFVLRRLTLAANENLRYKIQFD